MYEGKWWSILWIIAGLIFIGNGIGQVIFLDQSNWGHAFDIFISILWVAIIGVEIKNLKNKK